MEIIKYIVPALLSLIMLFNGAVRCFGDFDVEAAEAMYTWYIPTERHKRNWKFMQKTYGRYLLIFGCLNIATEIILIPFPIPTVVYMFVPSLLYMFAARILVEMKLKKLEEK